MQAVSSPVYGGGALRSNAEGAMMRWIPTLACFLTLAMPVYAAPVTVPFVGCASDGQSGPQPAPKGEPKVVKLDASIAEKLAFYSSDYGDGFLAPRGWYCASLIGSDGIFLFMSPQPIDTSALLSEREKGITGPIVQIESIEGETSGRDEVAGLVARYFPKDRAFVRRVISMMHQLASDYPAGPYPGDKLVARKQDVVEYVTPPHSKGVGTAVWLKPDDEPIYSTVMLLREDNPRWPSAVVVRVRLPKDLADLAPVILHDTERRYAGVK